jgi:hypothetical protein
MGCVRGNKENDEDRREKVTLYTSREIATLLLSARLLLLPKAPLRQNP